MRKLSDILAERARADADDRDLRSRTDAKKERRELEDRLEELARALGELAPSRRRKLGLPESVEQAVGELRAMKSHAARNRQLRIVRRSLRAADWQAVERDLATLLERGTLEAKSPAPAAGEPPLPTNLNLTEALRLAPDPAAAFEYLVARYPDLDRSRLRRLLRSVIKGETGATAALGSFVSELGAPRP